MSGSLAMSPSIEKMPSVMISLVRQLFAATSFASRSAMSECWYTAVWHLVIALASRMASMIEA